MTTEAVSPIGHSVPQRVARVLAQQGVTVRDIGTLFGVSHQRAQQLISD